MDNAINQHIIAGNYKIKGNFDITGNTKTNSLTIASNNSINTNSDKRDIVKDDQNKLKINGDLLVDGNLEVTGDIPVKWVTFTIDDNKYGAISTMTWEDWANSILDFRIYGSSRDTYISYDSYKVDNNYIAGSDGYYVREPIEDQKWELVTKDQKIEAKAYETGIKFYIDNKVYSCPRYTGPDNSSTTWEDWIKSSDNIDGFVIKPGSSSICAKDFSRKIIGVYAEQRIELKEYHTMALDKQNYILGIEESKENYSNGGTYTKTIRTDDATMLTYRDIKSKIDSDFDFVPPYKDIKEVRDGKGNKFVRIPKFYTQIKKLSNNHLSTKICTTKLDNSWKLNPCFRDENGNELDYIDIGKYLISKPKGDTCAKSVTGDRPLTGNSIQDFRTACTANGNGYQLFDIWVYQMLFTLFKIEFANSDTQKVLSGHVEPSIHNNGATDIIGPNKSWGGHNGIDAICYRGIENIWGNVFQWIDGFKLVYHNAFTTPYPSLYNQPAKYAQIANYNFFPSNFLGGFIRAEYLTYLDLKSKEYDYFLHLPTENSSEVIQLRQYEINTYSLDTHKADDIFISYGPDHHSTGMGVALPYGGLWAWQLKPPIATEIDAWTGGRLVYKPIK